MLTFLLVKKKSRELSEPKIALIADTWNPDVHAKLRPRAKMGPAAWVIVILSCSSSDTTLECRIPFASLIFLHQQRRLHACRKALGCAIDFSFG